MDWSLFPGLKVLADWPRAGADADADGNYWVKGGSFQDQPEALLTAAAQREAGETAAPWLGFRCVDNHVAK